MILTTSEIIKEIDIGNIVITPLSEVQINSNSVNLTLDNTLLRVKDYIIDSKKPTMTETLTITEKGLVLQPGELYLGRTKEYTETHNHVPILEGRSSTGRIGLDVHISAGFGDVGYCGNWTLELRVQKPLIIYPDMQVCQVYFLECKGEAKKYSGKYQGVKEIGTSKLWSELTAR